VAVVYVSEAAGIGVNGHIAHIYVFAEPSPDMVGEII